MPFDPNGEVWDAALNVGINILVTEATNCATRE